MGIALSIENYLVFLIFFLVFYILLRKSKVFGTDKTSNKINIFFSLIISFLVVFYNPLNIDWPFLLYSIYQNGIFVIIFVAIWVFSTLMISSLSNKRGWGEITIGFFVALFFAFITNLFLPISNYQLNLSFSNIDFGLITILALIIFTIVFLWKFVSA